jgi:F-type H+-transporting ATPase subunit b
MGAGLAGLLPVVAQGGEGSFLVAPNTGLMVWTLITFIITLLILRKYAFPKIGEALDKRRRLIEDSIDSAERTRREADELLREYRHRLHQARQQAEDIVERAHKAASRIEEEAKEESAEHRRYAMERTRREIEAETRRALDQLRQEVADLTVRATERVTRKSLDEEDHKRLIQEALEEADFSALAPSGDGRGPEANGGGRAERHAVIGGGGDEEEDESGSGSGSSSGGSGSSGDGGDDDGEEGSS